MIKKSLAAAIALTASLPMTTQAGVQIYGKMHASIDYVDPAGGAKEFWDVTSRDSRIGFKGSEDLGNGLKAIWKVESKVDIADGGGTWATRNSYIGLAGDWGTFLYGRHDTPMKISTGKLDLFGDRIADFNDTVGFIDERANDTILYISPNMNGLSFTGAVIPGWDSSDGYADGLADGYSIAAMYSNNGLFFSAAYEDLGDLADSSDDVDFTHWRIGAGYDINAFHIGVVYESQDYSASGVDEDGDLWQVSASYAFGNNVIKAMYGDADYDNAQGDDWGGDSWAVGLDHKFSKRTLAYLLYTDVEDDDYNDYALGGQSLRGYKVTGNGFSMGMIHKF